jgi:acyl-CoA reductase-like NAD-dependent aldehyde dehydrogenase
VPAGQPEEIARWTPVDDPANPGATIRTPLVLRLPADDEKVYTSEWFGPVSFLIVTDSTDESLRVFRETVRRHGALTASIYSTSPACERPPWRRASTARRAATGR